jgi:hypothetical protein
MTRHQVIKLLTTTNCWLLACPLLRIARLLLLLLSTGWGS